MINQKKTVIGVYCGSFAPVHKGHTTLMETVLREGYADKVLVVPTGDYWYKKIAMPLELRIACLKVFASSVILIDEVPEDCSAPYTIVLMERLKSRYPDADLRLLLGGDNLLKFQEWYRAEDLLRDYGFIIMNRDGIDTEKEMKRLGKDTYTVLSCPEVPVSSTYIRSHLHEPELLKDYVDVRVLRILSGYVGQNDSQSMIK